MTQRIVVSVLLSALLAGGCTENPPGEGAPGGQGKAVITDDGRTITFPQGSPALAQFAVSGVKKSRATISVVAPARIVASIGASTAGKDKVVLFESPDITSLYSSYRQSRSNADRASRNLVRIQDMFDNQAATGKDLNEAENDAATAHASMAEMEGRLRALGFSPAEFDGVPVNTVWVIADVPETDLNQVHHGEPATITFNSFPDAAYKGRAEAVGDIVDPVTRTVKVRVSVPNRGGKLLPGMFARAEFGEEHPSAIILPLAAVVTVEGKDHVFVEPAPGVFQRRDVTLVNSTRSEVVVLKGIADDEQVVTKGTMLLKGLSFGY
jgi:hypothetical protein